LLSNFSESSSFMIFLTLFHPLSLPLVHISPQMKLAYIGGFFKLKTLKTRLTLFLHQKFNLYSESDNNDKYK
jgi:hypothetical protein